MQRQAYQEAILEQMRTLVASSIGLKSEDDDGPLPPKGGFGRFSIEYMNQTGQNFLFHHLMPDEGGWNDQDAEWSDAFFNWLAYWRYLEAELQPELELQREQEQQARQEQDPLEQWFGGGDQVGDLL